MQVRLSVLELFLHRMFPLRLTFRVPLAGIFRGWASWSLTRLYVLLKPGFGFGNGNVARRRLARINNQINCIQITQALRVHVVPTLIRVRPPPFVSHERLPEYYCVSPVTTEGSSVFFQQNTLNEPLTLFYYNHLLILSHL